MLIDIYENQPRRKSVYRKKTFYGRLDHIFTITFFGLTLNEKKTLGFEPQVNTDPEIGDVVILAAIRTCKVEKDDPRMTGLNIHFYILMGALHFIDITSIQCLVGRVKDGEHGWGIIDRNGALTRAINDGDDSDTDID